MEKEVLWYTSNKWRSMKPWSVLFHVWKFIVHCSLFRAMHVRILNVQVVDVDWQQEKKMLSLSFTSKDQQQHPHYKAIIRGTRWGIHPVKRSPSKQGWNIKIHSNVVARTSTKRAGHTPRIIIVLFNRDFCAYVGRHAHRYTSVNTQCILIHMHIEGVKSCHVLLRLLCSHSLSPSLVGATYTDFCRLQTVDST